MIKKIISPPLNERRLLKEAFKEIEVKSFERVSPLRSSMETIKNSSLEWLKAYNETVRFTETDDIISLETEEGDGSKENKGLTEEERQQIKNETSWSDEIINAISSMEEYRIYRDAELQEADIKGRKSLVKSDIDWDLEDSMGRTNQERAEAGLPPIDKEKNTIELHHIGQKSNGPLAELTPDEHRGKENNSVLHNTQKPTEIDRSTFKTERSNHWKERASSGIQNA